MGWDSGSKSADAVLQSSGTGVTDDELIENGGTGTYANAESTYTLSGKVYLEFVPFDDGSPLLRIGGGAVNESYVVTTQSQRVGQTANGWGFLSDGGSLDKIHNNVNSSLGLGTPVVDDVIQVAFDTATGKIWFGLNNTFSGDPGAGTGEAYTATGTTFKHAGSTRFGFSVGLRGHFNPAAQTYTPPTGFSAPEADGAVLLAPADLAQAQSVEVAPLVEDPVTLTPAGLVQAQTVAEPTLALEVVSPADLAQSQTTAVAVLALDLVSPADLAQAQPLDTAVASMADILTPAALSQTQSLEVAPLLPVVADGEIYLAQLLEVIIHGGEEIAFSIGVDLPAVTGEFGASNGSVFAVNAELPPLESALLPGLQLDSTLPVLTGEWGALVGRVFSIDATLPAIRAVVSGAIPGLFGLNTSLPALQGFGTLLTGRVFSIDTQLPGLTASWSLRQQEIFSLDAAFPALEGEWVALTGSLLSLDATLPSIEGEWVLLADLSSLAYRGWAVNAFNLAHSPYDATDYDGLGCLGVNTYAGMSDGLYRLDGEDDAGTPIEAYYIHGFSDFGVEAVKAQRVAYIGCSTDGALELLVRTDTDGDDILRYPVEVPHNSEADHVQNSA